MGKQDSGLSTEWNVSGVGLCWQQEMTELSEAKKLMFSCTQLIHLDFCFALCQIPRFNKLDARLQPEEEHFTTATVPASMSPCFDQHQTHRSA
jgi:hypothetical protein